MMRFWSPLSLLRSHTLLNQVYSQSHAVVLTRNFASKKVKRPTLTRRVYSYCFCCNGCNARYNCTISHSRCFYLSLYISFCVFSTHSLQHKNLLKYATGYRGRSKNCFRIAIRRIEKAWQYAYRDRRRKKREWRKLWIQRLQAGIRLYGYNYSRLIPALKESNIQLNRKVLAEIAANEPFAFYSVVRVLEATNSGLQKRPNLNEFTGKEHDMAA